MKLQPYAKMTREERALHLLILWATLLLLVCFEVAAAEPSTNMSTNDQSALLALKSHITTDPQNILTTNWSINPTSNICNWVGVTCGARHLRVAALNLSYMGLSGTIPPHLGNLSFLIDLDFTNNSFHGTLPQELARLRRLKLINFKYNNFLGTIPSWFGSLSKLQTFNLYGNQFSGSVPSAIFNLSALQVINLRHNQLSEIPKEIGNLNELEELLVQKNALQGPVPMALFNMSSLNTLALAGNNLSGGIPDNMCEHLPMIQRLVLGDNQFDGPFPSKLWQCKLLRLMAFGNNKFNGTIPKNIGNLTQLRGIYLGSMGFTGTIPDSIGDLQNLKILGLGLNNLNGAIPSTMFNLSMITSISLPLNQLSGGLPANIGLGVPNLQELLLADNKLSGLIPSFISNASKLIRLELAANSFAGFIPPTLCALTNLEILFLHSNSLNIDSSTPEVNFLSCLPNLRNLTTLYMGLNPLNSILPVSFRNASSSSLRNLYLDNCNMRGNIPSDIGDWISLTSLNLGYNQFNGSIPKTMGRLQSLQALYLNDNKLQGGIPSQLCQLGNLAELTLEGNQLSGSIPSCFGDLALSLRRLSLASNVLNSSIPSSLWGLTYILLINLSSNSLTGSLSQDIEKLKVLTVVDLSNNHLFGVVPSSIGGLKDLVNLSLANNNFQGNISSSFGDLVSLELLDLSKNNLSGVIPKSLEQLPYLKYLNLSFNRLQGEIPTGGPFENFSAQSFFSNGMLCGAPRLHVPACDNSTLKPNSRKHGTSLLKYIIPGIISAVLLVAFAYGLILGRKKKVEVAIDNALQPQVIWRRVSQLELVRATNGFDESNLLGTGGFGSVYKGTISEGRDVAVKVFNLHVEGAFKSFDSECEVLSNIRHRNLIKIISCCSEIDFKALVLQYMPNGSLEKLLESQNCCLDIVERLNIMIDVAFALEYLHHGYSTPIVHCDLKPSNILLDDDMVAHVADFGVAKLLGEGDSIIQTMTLSTVGYMAPEFGMEGIVSTRGDAYSFGIVLMQTFTKRKPTDEMFVEGMSLKQWIANSLFPNDALILEVVDANLLGTKNDHDFVSTGDCLSSLMRLALACSAELPEDRMNMQDAVVTLNKIKTRFLRAMED